MMRLWRWLRPDSLGVQVALVLFAAIALFQVVVASTFLFTDPDSRLGVVELSEIVASAVLPSVVSVTSAEVSLAAMPTIAIRQRPCSGVLYALTCALKASLTARSYVRAWMA